MKNLFVIALTLIAVFSALCIETTTTYAQTNQVTLKPTDDTYVDNWHRNSNYGNVSFLLVENCPLINSSMEEIVWLKFSLPTIQNGVAIDSAILQLYVESVWFNDFNISAYSCADISWNEQELTYSNMPNYNITPLDSKMVHNHSQWYNWSVVDAVKNALNSNAKTLTIVLSASPNIMGAETNFYSKEESNYSTDDYSPNLTIHWGNEASPTYSPSPTETTSPALSPSPSVPEFPSWIILPLTAGIVTLVCFSKRNVLNSRRSSHMAGQLTILR